MHELLAWIEGSALGHAMRESGVWTYGLVNLAHILGVATLFGAVLVLDLRLLGAWRKSALAAIAAPTARLAKVGFAVAAASGVCLISTNATEYLGNPFLYAKFPAIALGLLNAMVLERLPAWRESQLREPTARERTQLAAAGGVSLFAWLSAIAAGRMIGYW